MPPDDFKLEPVPSAFDPYAQPQESAAQRMNRVSREIRTGDAYERIGGLRHMAGANPVAGSGYSGMVGAQHGPLSGNLLVSSGDRVAGDVQMVGGNVGVGPLSAHYMKPTFKGAPAAYGVGVGGKPFDADTYFGAKATHTPKGMQYGVNAARFGEDGGGYVGVSYNPSQRSPGAFFGYDKRFADGGPVTARRIGANIVPPEEQGAVSPSWEGVGDAARGIAAGTGPALETAGKYIAETPVSQMASDVGKLGSHMYEAAKENPAEFIGGMLPGVGNLYAAKDVAELKDKIAEARAAGRDDIAQQLEKILPVAATGAVMPFGAGAATRSVIKGAEKAAVHEASNLATKAAEVFGKTRDIREAGYVMPDGSMLDFTGRHQVQNDYARVGEFNRPVEGQRDWMAGERNVDHREVSDIIDAPEGISGTDAMTRFMNETNAIRNKPGIGFESFDVPTDQQLKALIGGHNKAYRGEPMLVELADRNTGDIIASTDFEKPTVEGVKKWFEENAPKESVVEKAAERELTNMGLYSHGAETALALPQAKGTPEQMAAMLAKQGVKPAELEGFTEAFAGRPSVTREEAAQYFRERMPQVEEKVLSTNPKLSDEQVEREYRRVYGEPFTSDGERLNIDEMRSMVTSEWAGIDSQYVPKFQQYTLPGGENYREVLLKLPKGAGATKEALEELAAAKQRSKEATKAYNDILAAELEGTSNIPQEQVNALRREADIAHARVKNFEHLANKPMFESAHWRDDPNVLAHLRMSDRTGPNGEKILHIEEIQSDWGQQGKKAGFKTEIPKQLQASVDEILKNKIQPNAELLPVAMQEKDGSVALRNVPPDFIKHWEKSNILTPDEAKTLLEWNDKYFKSMEGIPSAPYVANTAAWTDLALKRALKEAAEGGYDRVVWTPGVEQAKRYDLSKQIDSLQYVPKTGKLYAYKDGQLVVDKATKPNELEGLVGKEVAKKLLDTELKTYGSGNPVHYLEGQDLSVGGEGMKGYYDKIVPTQLQKLLKKLDPEAKIEKTQLPINKEGWHITDPSATVSGKWMVKSSDYNSKGLMFDTEAEARAAMAKKIAENSIDVPVIQITSAMRENILKGMPHMAEGGMVEEAEPTLNAEEVNFAEGGAVNGAGMSPEDRVGETAADVANLIQEGEMDQRKLAYLIRMASTGTIAPDKAYEFAEEILAQNVPALMQRFARYPRAIRILARVDLALGGLGGQALGLVGNQKIRNEPVGADGYAKGGAVKKKKSAKRMPYQGDEQAFQAFADFAIEEYGPQLGGNMAKRAEGNAAKLLFALQQQEKNSAESPEQYREKITMLNQMGRQFNINPKAAFNRTTDAMDTKRELASILKSDHKINPAFQAALQRMDRLVGSR
jgi:hypothetical protein